MALQEIEWGGTPLRDCASLIRGISARIRGPVVYADRRQTAGKPPALRIGTETPRMHNNTRECVGGTPGRDRGPQREEAVDPNGPLLSVRIRVRQAPLFSVLFNTDCRGLWLAERDRP